MTHLLVAMCTWRAFQAILHQFEKKKSAIPPLTSFSQDQNDQRDVFQIEFCIIWLFQNKITILASYCLVQLATLKRHFWKSNLVEKFCFAADNTFSMLNWMFLKGKKMFMG